MIYHAPQKKQNNIKFYQTLYFKILVIFCGGLFLLCIFSAALFKIYAGYMIEKNFSGIRQQTEYTFQTFEENINQVKKSVDALGYDNDVIQLAYSGRDSELRQQYQHMNSLYFKLLNIHSMSPYVKNIRFYMPSIDCLLDTISYAACEWRGYDEVTYEKRKQYLQTTGENFYCDDTVVSFLFYNLSNNVYREIDDYIVEVILDKEAMSGLLEAQAVYENSYCVLADQDNENIFFCNNEEIRKYQEKGMKLDDNRYKHNFAITDLGGEEYYYLKFLSRLSFFSMDMMLFLPTNSAEILPKTVIIAFIIFLLIELSLMIGYILYCWKLWQIPFRRLMDATYQLEQGNFEISFSDTSVSNLELKVLMQRFEKMVCRLNTLIGQVYRQKILMKNSELKQLQSQINPHFLYNSFFILSRMIQSEDYENANSMLKHLSKYFEYITRSQKDSMTLEREMNHIKEYMNIQKIRFGDRFSFQLSEIPFADQNLEIPRLSLQPVVENYFKYGMENSDKPMNLNISFRHEGRYDRIIFEDNVCAITRERLLEINRKAWDDKNDFEMTGLINVSHRLRLLFGKKSGVFMRQIKSGGIMTVLQMQREGRENGEA